MNIELNSADTPGERESDPTRRFFVLAPSVSSVRRALYRAPGGARVVGRYNRDTIECLHTMNDQSHRRHWPIILSRLEKSGLRLVERP
jgi:hypothetical protein